MANYLITWVDYAMEQYLALDQVRTELDDRLGRLAEQPKNDARYDKDIDRWSAEFDDGRSLVVYIVNDEYRRVVILRVVHLG